LRVNPRLKLAAALNLPIKDVPALVTRPEGSCGLATMRVRLSCHA
jgi:hypothetical protein